MPSLLWRRVGVAAVAALTLASICAHAQTVSTSREDAEATERRFFSKKDVIDIVEEVLEEIDPTVCTRCARLGDVALFDAPLYSDCDAILLNSLVNEGFEYGTPSRGPWVPLRRAMPTSRTIRFSSAAPTHPGVGTN